MPGTQLPVAPWFPQYFLPIGPCGNIGDRDHYRVLCHARCAMNPGTDLGADRGPPLCEIIHVEGHACMTLRELLAPEVHTVFVGINPSLASVQAGHYYQGRLGRQIWRCLKQAGIGQLASRDRGQEDLTLFRQGFGFMDLVRRPSISARDLAPREWTEGPISLVQRLQQLPHQPCIVFTYKSVADRAEAILRQQGFATFTLGCTHRQFRVERFQALAQWLAAHNLPVPLPGTGNRLQTTARQDACRAQHTD